ncbi:MAG: hypothetical protein KH333_09885 [Clostridium sp.]|nr:hypothetical protein [Clostridium sp.]
MNLVRKEKEIKIGEEEYIMYFDMSSIVMYKELTNRFFTHGVNKLFEQDDEEIMYFMASTLRRKDNPKKPLGKEIFEADILQLLLMHKWDVIDLVASSLPVEETPKKK